MRHWLVGEEMAEEDETAVDEEEEVISISLEEIAEETAGETRGETDEDDVTNVKDFAEFVPNKVAA